MADYSCFKVLALSNFLKHVLDPVPNHVSTKDAIIIFLPILTIFQCFDICTYFFDFIAENIKLMWK